MASLTPKGRLVAIPVGPNAKAADVRFTKLHIRDLKTQAKIAANENRAAQIERSIRMTEKDTARLRA
jgi:hypothetical protein